MASSPSLELFYFDIPGKGEAIRLACAYANLPLKDTRFANRDEFTAMKEVYRHHCIYFIEFVLFRLESCPMVKFQCSVLTTLRASYKLHPL